MHSVSFTRDRLLGTLSAIAAAGFAAPAYTWPAAKHGALAPRLSGESEESVLDLEIESLPLVINGRTGRNIRVNDSIPSPLVNRDVARRIRSKEPHEYEKALEYL